EDRLRLHLVGDPQAIEHLGEMDAARAAARWIDIGDRLRGEQRAFQGVWRRDIGLGCALANGHDDAGAGEHRHVARNSLAVLHESVDPLLGNDTTSAISPPWTRFTVAPRVANVIASVCPVARSNFGPRS